MAKRGAERGEMRKLSERQRRIMAFVERYTTEHGYPPSIREIGQAAAISSTSVVDYNLRALEREGLIRRDREVSRGLGLVGRRPAASSARPQLVRVPIKGRIAAGEPIEAIEGHEDYLEFTSGMVPDGCYALQVKGKSMIEDLIDDGDFVVIRPQQTARNGDIVVAQVEENSVTLKRFFKEKGRVRLQPANEAYPPQFYDDVRIQGKLIGVIRRLD